MKIIDLLIYVLDIAGTIAFALSGAVMAMRKDMDLFGVCFIALLPAVGGGTIRDLVIGEPVFWTVNSLPLWIALSTAVISFFLPRLIHETRHIVRWADAAGLAIFAVLGTSKTWLVTGDPLVSLLMGVVTATVGGIIRDTICNEVPLVLKQDIYATAAVAGSTLWLAIIFAGAGQITALWVAALTTFLIRAGAMIKGWQLPGGKSRYTDE